MKEVSHASMRAAAALADVPGPCGADLEGETVDPAAVVATLRSNRVPLLELAGAAGSRTSDGLMSSVDWREALASERSIERDLSREFEEVAGLFASGGVTPVLFKSAGGLPYRSSNVDVLVRPDQLETSARLLEGAGHLRFPHYREEHKLLFRKFRHGRSIISIHLHDAVSWGRVLILPGEEVVERSRPAPRGSYRVPSLEDLLLITLAHSLYETDQIRIADLRALRLCGAEPSFDWSAASGRVRDRGWSIGFFSILLMMAAVERSLYSGSRVPAEILEQGTRAVAGARWARGQVHKVIASLEGAPPRLMPLPISKIYSKVHYLARLLGEARRSPDERLVDVLATVWNLLSNRLHLRCRPAPVIGLSGIDGSGKTAAIETLASTLTLCEVPVRVVWSRGGFSSWMTAAKRVARAILPGDLPRAGDAVSKRRWLARPVPGAAFAMTVVLEQLIGHLVRVRLPRLLGFTVLCDRCALDTAVDLLAKIGPSSDTGRWAARLAVRLIPAPDCLILLNVRPLVAAKRKSPDAHAGDLAEQARGYETLARAYSPVFLNAERPRQEVGGEVVDRVLRLCFERFERRGVRGPEV